MAAPLQSCTKQEMRSVIRFLNAEGVKPVEIYIRILAKYSASYMSKMQVYKWVQKFKNGVQTGYKVLKILHGLGRHIMS
jgi:hypothetical protein